MRVTGRPLFRSSRTVSAATLRFGVGAGPVLSREADPAQDDRRLVRRRHVAGRGSGAPRAPEAVDDHEVEGGADGNELEGQADD